MVDLLGAVRRLSLLPKACWVEAKGFRGWGVEGLGFREFRGFRFFLGGFWGLGSLAG